VQWFLVHIRTKSDHRVGKRGSGGYLNEGRWKTATIIRNREDVGRPVHVKLYRDTPFRPATERMFEAVGDEFGDDQRYRHQRFVIELSREGSLDRQTYTGFVAGLDQICAQFSQIARHRQVNRARIVESAMDTGHQVEPASSRFQRLRAGAVGFKRLLAQIQEGCDQLQIVRHPVLQFPK